MIWIEAYGRKDFIMCKKILNIYHKECDKLHAYYNIWMLRRLEIDPVDYFVIKDISRAICWLIGAKQSVELYNTTNYVNVYHAWNNTDIVAKHIINTWYKRMLLSLD